MHYPSLPGASAHLAGLARARIDRGVLADTDPLATLTATVSGDGKSLKLGPATKYACGDRLAILQGTWTRSR